MDRSSKKRAWLTGDVGDESAALICRRFFVPDSPAFRESVNGALLELTYPWNWEQYGSLTEQQTADVMLTMYNRYMLDEACSYEVPAPYWESDNDSAGQQAPENSQDWYGVITSEVWYEQLSDWVIAGFLAIAASPEAAIQYVMYVPRARLAFRTHAVGALVKIFLDGTEIFAGDTQSAANGVMEVDVDAEVLSGHAPPYDLQVRKASASELHVIRKRLDPNEVYSETLRYNSSTDTVQKTYDGGTTWVDYPLGDPRTSAVFQKPPRGAGDVRCDAAANMVQWLHDFIDAVIALLDAAAAIAMVARAILDFLDLLTEGAALLIQIAVDVAGTLSALGAAALTSAFSVITYDDLLCILYCGMALDGSVSADQLSAIQAQVTATLGATAASVVNLIFSLQGNIGVTNAGAIGTVVGDCSACTSCNWCHEFDFSVDDGGFSVYVKGAYVAGFYWDGVNSLAGGTTYNMSVGVQLSFASTTNVLHIEMEYTTNRGTASAGGASYIRDLTGGGATLVTSSDANHTDEVLAWNGNRNMDAVAFWVNGARSATQSVSATGTAHLFRVKMSGTGDDPFPGVYSCP